MQYCCKSTTLIVKANKRAPPKEFDQAPPRITSNVKQNLQFIKLWKEFERKRVSTPKPATSYRKKRIAKEDLPDDIEHFPDPALALYHTKQIVEDAYTVLLVDGYNVCGYWGKLKKHFIGGRLELARQKLVDELVAFSLAREVKAFAMFDSMFSGFRLIFIQCLLVHIFTAAESAEVKVVVVFDAMHSGLSNRKETFAGVDIVFSAESCADSWIEKEVAALREDGCAKVWVVTSDHDHQQAAYGAGAYIWSSRALVSEIKESHKEVDDMIQQHRTTSFQGRLLKHNLDPKIVAALKEMRNQLHLNELKNH